MDENSKLKKAEINNANSIAAKATMIFSKWCSLLHFRHHKHISPNFFGTKMYTFLGESSEHSLAHIGEGISSIDIKLFF